MRARHLTAVRSQRAQNRDIAYPLVMGADDACIEDQDAGCQGEDEDEGEDREQRAALKGGQGERAADEAAKRLDLGIDHLHDLAGRNPPK